MEILPVCARSLCTERSSADNARIFTSLKRSRRIGRFRHAERPPSMLGRFFRQLNNVLLYVLMVSAVLTALLDHWLDTAVIVAAVLVNAIVGFVQEGRAEQAIRAIRNMLKTKVYVLRDGMRVDLDAQALVPGDVIVLQAATGCPLMRVSSIAVGSRSISRS